MNKPILAFAIFALAFIMTDDAFAQLKNKNVKAIRKARKEARQYKRDDWSVAAGALPMDMMFEKSWTYQLAESKPGRKKYIWADQTATGQTHAGAKMQAIELAKVDLASQIEAEIISLTEASVANQQLTRDEAQTIQKVVQGSKSIVTQTLTNVEPTVLIYKDIGDNNVQCKVMLFFDKEDTVEQAKKKIKKKLEEETEIIHDKLDKMLGLDGDDD